MSFLVMMMTIVILLKQERASLASARPCAEHSSCIVSFTPVLWSRIIFSTLWIKRELREMKWPAPDLSSLIQYSPPVGVLGGSDELKESRTYGKGDEGTEGLINWLNGDQTTIAGPRDAWVFHWNDEAVIEEWEYWRWSILRLYSSIWCTEESHAIIDDYWHFQQWESIWHIWKTM